MKKYAVALLLSACALARAADWKDDAGLDQLFKKEGVTGTFVLHDVAADRYIVHNRKRADVGYYPASTYKIPNSLIGLSEGVVANVDEVLPYGGKPTRRPEWARDMSLRDAIKVSNVPVYQGLARKIGMRRMREDLRKLDYGNMQTGEVVDTFWLEGPLKISAVQQTRFLDKLAQDRLPFPKPAMAGVREIMRQDADADAKAELYAKTGWTGTADKDVDIGWWVGFVRKDGKLYTFALNLDIRNDEDGAKAAAKRVPLGKASLKALGLL